MFTKVHTSLCDMGFIDKPAHIDDPIRALCRSINPTAEPVFVPVSVRHGAAPRNCFFNVADAVEQEGGAPLNGWAIWEWPGVFIEAEHHAIWIRDGQPVDVTPHEPHAPREILFLPDPGATFDRETFRPRANVKQPVGEAACIKEYLAAGGMREAIMQENSHECGVILEDRALTEYRAAEHRMHQRKVSILLWLANRTARNDPCFCRSGRKFKKCCLPRFQ